VYRSSGYRHSFLIPATSMQHLLMCGIGAVIALFEFLLVDVMHRLIVNPTTSGCKAWDI